MYTQTERPNHLAQEVIDNSVDEAIAGHAKRIDVVLHSDNSVSVTDDGRGMPVDKHKNEGVSGVEVILTRLHAGGKFSNKNYRFSGGLHGVGVSVVNALSTRLEVSVRRGGKQWTMSFANGRKKKELKATGKVGQRNTGTTIRFWPDPVYFDSAEFDVRSLKQVLRAKAVLCSGLRVTFEDESKPANNETWEFEQGLSEYLLDRIEGADLLPEKPFLHHHQDEEGEVEFALIWDLEQGTVVTESFVNLIPTAQGGTHVNGLRAGVADAVREFAEYRDLIPRGVKLVADDVCANVNFILSVRLKDPQFTGQTKDRLSSREATGYVIALAREAFAGWLTQQVAAGDRLVDMAIRSAQARQRAGKEVKRKKLAGGPALPGKLADCASQDLEQTELFLVEGDSAGGSAKQARDKDYQAILPLRGKILNTWEVPASQVLASQEVHDIAVAIGVDPGATQLSGLRYGKICILADADSDGAHIATLLCGLFVKHFPKLVEDGRVYVALPPLYRIDVGKDVFYAKDDKERDEILQRIEKERPRAKTEVQRFKGLGEMNPPQLRETAMAVATRRLVQLQIDRPQIAGKTLDMLLGKKNAADRKAWLTKKGDQASLEI